MDNVRKYMSFSHKQKENSILNTMQKEEKRKEFGVKCDYWTTKHKHDKRFT